MGFHLTQHQTLQGQPPVPSRPFMALPGPALGKSNLEQQPGICVKLPVLVLFLLEGERDGVGYAD